MICLCIYPVNCQQYCPHACSLTFPYIHEQLSKCIELIVHAVMKSGFSFLKEIGICRKERSVLDFLIYACYVSRLTDSNPALLTTFINAKFNVRFTDSRHATSCPFRIFSLQHLYYVLTQVDDIWCVRQ